MASSKKYIHKISSNSKIINNCNVNCLIAKKISKHSYLFDIFLQGEEETIFLDI